jgi:hypothetical protein
MRSALSCCARASSSFCRSAACCASQGRQRFGAFGLLLQRLRFQSQRLRQRLKGIAQVDFVTVDLGLRVCPFQMRQQRFLAANILR